MHRQRINNECSFCAGRAVETKTTSLLQYVINEATRGRYGDSGLGKSVQGNIRLSQMPFSNAKNESKKRPLGIQQFTERSNRPVSYPNGRLPGFPKRGITNAKS